MSWGKCQFKNTETGEECTREAVGALFFGLIKDPKFAERPTYGGRYFIRFLCDRHLESFGVSDESESAEDEER